MIYRIVKIVKNENIWYEAHYRKFFFWFTCFRSRSSAGDPATYYTVEDAELAVSRHKRLRAAENRSLVRLIK